jgi:DNA-binding NtrC family response regulator
LLDHFLDQYNIRLGKTIQGIDAKALYTLSAYDWPGNIRELENVTERCVLFCDGDVLTYKDLPPDLTGENGFGSSDQIRVPKEIGDGLKDQVKAATANLERQLITKALEQTGRNVTKTARLLKISRKSLQTKMKDLGLRDEPTGS